ncbi:MAG: cytochrome c oxidase subunit II [Dongiaceae bacterium]
METLQSTMHPAGTDAAAIAQLSWVLFVGGGLVFAVVMGLTAIASLGAERRRRFLSERKFIVIAGAILPAIVLTALLVYGLTLTGTRIAIAEADALRIEVTGEQWWWRVRYPDSGGDIITANEIRIPADRPIELTLLSADVIHSFWVPNLAGKIDMIPGTVNRLTLRATQPGEYRGQCAEFCGGPHALMAFHVVALEPAAFDIWLAAQREPAASPETALQQEGADLFVASGCGGCHSIRGTAAIGTIGPDLTHVGGRLTIAAATLPADAASFARWIRDNQYIKPNNLMPPFGTLSDDELAALGAYLEHLK